jgi:hypothetical protein
VRAPSHLTWVLQFKYPPFLGLFLIGPFYFHFGIIVILFQSMLYW